MRVTTGRGTDLVRPFPHWCTTQSHSISPDPPTDRLSSANFFSRSVSSSAQAPWFTPAPVAGAPAIVVAEAAAGEAAKADVEA
jgi:hypothetical protein